MPAKAGIERVWKNSWIPAFAGMTTQDFRNMNHPIWVLAASWTAFVSIWSQRAWTLQYPSHFKFMTSAEGSPGMAPVVKALCNSRAFGRMKFSMVSMS
jgi:hypothetical protein